MSLPSGCDVGVGVRCQCRRNMTLVLSGCSVGVGIVGRRCRCRNCGCWQLRTACPTPPTRHALLNIHKPLPKPVQDAVLSTTTGNTMPCTVFASAASTSPLVLAGMTTAAVPMQKALCRVPDADAAKSSDMVRAHSDVCRVGIWGRLGSVAVVWGTSVVKRLCGRNRRPRRGHSHVAVRLTFQRYSRCQRDMIRSGKVRDNKRVGNVRIAKNDDKRVAHWPDLLSVSGRSRVRCMQKQGKRGKGEEKQ